MLPAGDDAILIFGSLLIMLLVGGVFLGVILFINKRLNEEQRQQVEREKRAAMARQGQSAEAERGDGRV